MTQKHDNSEPSKTRISTHMPTGTHRWHVTLTFADGAVYGPYAVLATLSWHARNAADDIYHRTVSRAERLTHALLHPSYVVQHVDEDDQPLPCHGSGGTWGGGDHARAVCRACKKSSQTLLNLHARDLPTDGRHYLVPKHSGRHEYPAAR